VFDVGANRGQTVSRFRTEFPEAAIYAFEPDLAAFSELKARTANDSKTRSFHLALGERDGSATLHENSSDVTSSLLPNSPRISQFAPPQMCTPKDKRTVPLMRIDTFCAKESIGRIDLLKIDTQGYERYILDGAGSLLSPASIRGLLLEVLFVDLYENQTWCGEVLESLRSRGYRLFGFTGVACDDIHGWKWADAMFIGDF
jgi:FkbM family methyltransferase